MQEIKKRRIVLASVLKPVDDPRMFEKMGQSLSRDFEVHIIGTRARKAPDHTNIFFHPLSSYSRFSVNRILAPLTIFFKIVNIRPQVLIICTHELLWMVLAARIFTGCKVIYDIRENYFRNIRHTNAFPKVLRVTIAVYVRFKEWITAPFVSKFLLAEAGYAKELKFIGSRHVTIENKVKKVALPASQKWSAMDDHTHLLFSGTLSPTTGIFVAIDLATKLHAIDPKIRLHILGFSPMKAVQHEIARVVGDKPYIFFEESVEPVPHVEILKAVQMADAGIIAYPPNLSTTNTIPTKLYEYLGYKLPILLTDHHPWIQICEPYNAAVTFHPAGVDASQILETIRQTTFYTADPVNVFWEFEEAKFLHTIASLLK
jgi:glycosyltransferase involved in cell wall biosynthesis